MTELEHRLNMPQAISGRPGWVPPPATTRPSKSWTLSSASTSGVVAMLRGILTAHSEAGGNFIDTGNAYQDEQSEMIIGEWMEKRDIRDEIVLAT